MNKTEAVASIRHTETAVGQIYPVLLDKQGEIIDGRYRLKANPNWPRLQLDHVASEEQRLLIRLISNTCRKDISPNEKTAIIGRLGELR